MNEGGLLRPAMLVMETKWSGKEDSNLRPLPPEDSGWTWEWQISDVF